MATSLESMQLSIATLQQQLESNDPGYKTRLAEIHSILSKDPEMTHMLKTREEISVIFEAMRRFKDVEIPITERKKEKSPSSSIKGPVSLDQF